MSGVMSGFGVDASVPLAAGKGVAQTNPLESVGNFAKTLGAINQTQIQGQTIQSNNMSLAQQMKQLAYSHLAAGLANGSIKTLADATHAMGTLEGFHGISVQPVLNDMATQVGMGDDPLAVLKSLAVANSQPPEKAVGALAPVPGSINVGGEIIPTLAPAAGMPGQGVPAQSAPGFANTLSPEAQANQVARPATAADVAKAAAQGITLTEGTPITEGMVQRLYGQGLGGLVSGGRTPIRGPASAGGTPLPNAFPDALLRNKPQTPGQPAIPGQPVATGFAPGTPEDITAYKAAQLGIPDAQRRVQSLQEAKHALEVSVAGRGSGALNAMKSYLNTGARALWLNSIGIDPYSVETMNYDIVKKYLTDYARQAVNGTGTNLAREQATEANPNPEINPEASLHIIKTNIGRERQSIAQALEAPQNGIGYGKHAATFAGETDPTAFALDEYSTEERNRIIAARKTMTKEQRARFDKSLEIAARHKLISVPGSQ
jgi:hypothetical protein